MSFILNQWEAYEEDLEKESNTYLYSRYKYTEGILTGIIIGLLISLLIMFLVGVYY